MSTARSGALGGICLGLLAALLGTTIWLTRSRFVPLVGERSVSYLLAAPSFLWLTVAIVTSGVALAAIHVVVSRAGSGEISFAPARLRYFSPLVLAGLRPLALPVLWPSLAGWWTPVVFVAVDLHRALSVFALVLFIARADTAAGGPLLARWQTASARFSGADRRLLADLALVAAVVGLVIASSPRIRFSNATIGDEPKYIRYAETWWQGGGMEVGGTRDVSDLPRHDRPRLIENVRMLGPALRADLAQLAADIRYLGNWEHWDHRFNKAVYAGNWIVKGRNGGFYQMHGPGISLVLLPGYTVDRLFDRHYARFAGDLFTANLTMLAIFVVLTVAMFRLFETVTGHRVAALLAAGATALSLPLAAFAFPFYPETLAATIVCLVCREIATPSPRLTPARLAIAGAGLGMLGWLHVRFLGVGAISLAWYCWRLRRHPRQLWFVAAPFLAGTSLLALHTYHVTGSVVPTALYAADGGYGAFAAHWVRSGLVGIGFDRENGLLPLAPVYLLALPGLGMLLVRQPATFFFVAAVVPALFIPAAGHGYQTDGTTPLRHVLATLPLLAVGIAVWLAAVARRPPLFAASAIVALISIHQAMLYNLQNDKKIVATIAPTLSGWDVTLAFPLIRRVGLGGFDAGALWLWELAAAALFAAGVVWALRRLDDHRGFDGARGMMAGAAATVALVAAIGVAAIAAGGQIIELRLLKPLDQATLEARGFLESRRDAVIIRTPQY